MREASRYGFRHQEEAIEIARRNEPFVVATGTGSGKSLAYLIPIVDHVLRNRPEKHQVRAIIVYPMNALINSQFKALEGYAKNNPGTALRFDRYTGQEQNEARQRILSRMRHSRQLLETTRRSHRHSRRGTRKNVKVAICRSAESTPIFISSQ